MVDVTSMSDAELRTKLLEFGFPPMPVTGTTRKVMEKKLKILLENKSKANSEGRRSLARYSSEEESDIDTKVTKRDKSKRATMAAPPSRVTLRKSTRKADTDSDTEARKPAMTEEKRVTTHTSKVTTVESGFDTGSDSESEIIEQSYKSPINNHSYKKSFLSSPMSPTVSSASYVESTRKYSPPKLGEDVISKPISTSYSSHSPSRYSSYGTNATDYAADRLNQIRSRLSLGTSTYDRPVYSTTTTTTTTNRSTTIEKEDDQIETPFLSNFTKRLSQLSNSPRADSYKNDVIKEHDTNGSGRYEMNSLHFSRPFGYNLHRDYQSAKRINTQNNLVSFAVIALALLFFFVVAILYLGLHSGQTALDTIGSDLKVNYCDKSASYRPDVNCVFTTDLRDAVKIYEIVKSDLLKRSVENRCVSSKFKAYATENEIVNQVERRTSGEFFDVSKSLRRMEILTLTNPQWEISLLKVGEDEAVGGSPISGYDELAEARNSGEIALVVLEPSLPWSCSFYYKMAAIIQTCLILGAGFIAVYATNTGYKYYKHYRQKQRDELFLMVERILDILQTNATEDGDNFLVINHVRDMLLPINNRARMERIWRKSVDFINKNESRVRTELQVVQGEPYEVWRWLGSPNLNTSGSPRNKSWQGQAFETQVGSVNSLPCSPTPCLKIRGMVDEGDRNLHTIREAVLSKCAHQCRILHCAVDTNSKCVYLKCADQDDAAIAYRSLHGWWILHCAVDTNSKCVYLKYADQDDAAIAYRSLHGWWYAGNLVTVKYLRSERYMLRHPDSPVSGPPYLKPLQPATDWTS